MSEVLVLKQDRTKIAWAVLVSFGFVVIGVWMFLDPDGSSRYSPELVKVIGVLAVAFFGWSGLFGVRSLLDPSELVLTPQGFEVKGWRPRALISWSDVEEFSVTQVMLTKFVSCTLTSEAEDRLRRARRLAIGPVNKTGLVPQRLEQSPDYACRLLEDWRRTHG